MPSFAQWLRSFVFSADPDAVLSDRVLRNEEARLRLATARVEHQERERAHEAKLAALDHDLHAHQERYAEQARPLLQEFDDVAVAAHYYEEVKHFLISQRAMVGKLAADELGHFAYLSKKLLSVSLNFEALRRRLRSGEPFRTELQALLDDAENDELRLIAAPLFSFAAKGAPQGEAVRAAAWGLARAIEETGRAPAQEPVRGWLNFLKFRTTFSPTTVQMNQILARGRAQVFMRHMNTADYPNALKAAEEVFESLDKENEATYDTFLATYRSFRRVIFPHIAANIFDMYAQSSLNDSRFASVESVLKG
ncbi:unnamed protein product [Phytomonas sp. Hart1]|nr:unnamed protein product [Phytomonas sp. Hart1]|eukprot:CCW67159.1 unnamed protein product [Phytomonas sp. isolate Hart1]